MSYSVCDDVFVLLVSSCASMRRERGKNFDCMQNDMREGRRVNSFFPLLFSSLLYPSVVRNFFFFFFFVVVFFSFSLPLVATVNNDIFTLDPFRGEQFNSLSILFMTQYASSYFSRNTHTHIHIYIERQMAPERVRKRRRKKKEKREKSRCRRNALFLFFFFSPFFHSSVFYF